MGPVTHEEDWVGRVTSAAVDRARSLRRRRRGLRRGAALSFVVVLAVTGTLLATSGGGGSPGPSGTSTSVVKVRPIPIDTSHFYALWQRGVGAGEVVEEFSATTGRALRQVATIPQRYLGGAGVTLAQAPDGWLVLTESSGPRFRSGVAGGDPAPDSCSGAVLELDPQTGQRVGLFRAPSSEWIGDATPSPDGRDVAYLEGQCNRAFMNAHVVVRQLATGRQWSIGTDAVVCHELSPPAWGRDSRSLVLGYGPSLVTASQAGGEGYGICTGSAPAELGAVGALRPASIRSVSLHPAPRGCSYVEAVADDVGPLALETCGADGLGPTTLVQFGAGYHVVVRQSLPPSADGTSLSVSPDGRLVLVDEYEAPSYGAGGRALRSATEWVEIFDGSSLRLVRELPGEAVSLTSAVW